MKYKKINIKNKQSKTPFKETFSIKSFNDLIKVIQAKTQNDSLVDLVSNTLKEYIGNTCSSQYIKLIKQIAINFNDKKIFSEIVDVLDKYEISTKYLDSEVFIPRSKNIFGNKFDEIILSQYSVHRLLQKSVKKVGNKDFLIDLTTLLGETKSEFNLKNLLANFNYLLNEQGKDFVLHYLKLSNNFKNIDSFSNLDVSFLKQIFETLEYTNLIYELTVKEYSNISKAYQVVQGITNNKYYKIKQVAKEGFYASLNEKVKLGKTIQEKLKIINSWSNKIYNSILQNPDGFTYVVAK
ncbi:MAG: hypothetical protein AB7V77_01125 [Candidatus Woesearchaeota archaeon]